jgi:hypothetical protein
MGMIVLDLQFRFEKVFKIRIPRGWLAEIGIREAGDDATLAEIEQYLLRLCRDQNVVPPQDSWKILVGVVVEATGIKLKDLTPETQLVRDIAPFG